MYKSTAPDIINSFHQLTKISEPQEPENEEQQETINSLVNKKQELYNKIKEMKQKYPGTANFFEYINDGETEQAESLYPSLTPEEQEAVEQIGKLYQAHQEIQTMLRENFGDPQSKAPGYNPYQQLENISQDDIQLPQTDMPTNKYEIQ